MRRTSILHALISVLVAIGVPGAVFALNGVVGFEFMVLGAVLGFAYWYWGPSGL